MFQAYDTVLPFAEDPSGYWTTGICFIRIPVSERCPIRQTDSYRRSVIRGKFAVGKDAFALDEM